jgi:hypothetical protein
MARDPARARLCAYTQRPTDQMLEPFAGRAMLMTVYANGEGATRNPDLAIRLACTLEGAEPAEYDRRVTHLAALRDRHWQGRDFSYCDDIDSGLGTGLCASHRAALARPQREAAQRALIARWSPDQRLAYEPLRRAFEEFVAASASGDLAQGGTSYAPLRNRLEQGLRDQFADMLRRLERGRAPHFTSAQFRTEDLQLNQAYQARLADERQYDAPGISPDSIQNAQRLAALSRHLYRLRRGQISPRGPRQPRRLAHPEPVADYPGHLNRLVAINARFIDDMRMRLPAARLGSRGVGVLKCQRKQRGIGNFS